jgi:hypothetical protein
MPASDFDKPSIDHAGVHRRSVITFVVLFVSVFLFLAYLKRKPESLSPPETGNERLDFRYSKWESILERMIQKGYPLWKIDKVHVFFKHLTPIVMKECLKKGVPPAAVLAMAALESGYGTGYVARVSGNILSLNAREGEPELPPLKVPVTKEKQVVIDRRVLEEMLAYGYDFQIEARPPSFKKDYRPGGIAGTDIQLDYFLNHPQEKYAAWKRNIVDLIEKRLSLDSPIPAYRETEQWCRTVLASHSLEKLLSEDAARRFLEKIGGRPLSFNRRISWREKTFVILDRLGLETFLRLYLETYREYYALDQWEWDLERS